MNPPNSLSAQTVVLAAGNPASLWAFVVGLVVVLILIGGFWLGFHRRSEVNRHPEAGDHPSRLNHEGDGGSSAGGDTTSFPDDGSRLSPHELGGHREKT
jgi:hypothetical protein